MDGLDLSVLSQLDEEIFDKSQESSDEESDALPMPDCVGLDSALQDAQKDSGVRSNNKTKSDIERERELSVMKPNSIRREILERSLNSGNNFIDQPQGNHVMNIVEKAGMKGIDKEKINKIIREASEGSLFYKRQAQRQEEIHRSIEKMLNKVKCASAEKVANAQVTCDNMLKVIKSQRVFNRIIVHFDLDMFFAAVEIRDNPTLADKPIAVGGDSMVSTSNYIARKFGVRAAMPGFIAKKLCPDLLLIKPNGAKYRAASAEVFDVLEQYDPDLTPMSLDEAYLDLTEHIKMTLEKEEQEFQEYYDGTLPDVWWRKAFEKVTEIRNVIYEKTSLTCSAGIACNTMISKIATDINKPNGQFMVKGYPKDVEEFIAKTPVEKVSGIGKVSGQFLNALDIKTCGDIYEKRHILPLVFYPVNIKFYLRSAIGDGSTKLQSDDQRKSKSIEHTFSSISDPLLLIEKLNKMCEELCSKYLKPYRIRGRTVTVKLKRSNFSTLTRAFSLLVSTNDKEVIFKAARNLLQAELNSAGPNVSYRLLGVRLSNLADENLSQNQTTIDALLRNQEYNTLKESDPDTNESTSVSESAKIVSNSELNQIVNEDAGMLEDLLTDSIIPDPCLNESNRGVKRTHEETKSDCVLTQSSSQKTPKKLYDCFMEHNSQVFSKLKSNEFEPLPCPYCWHLFKTFESLESHVKICSKNKSN